jgi:hypothetical protein
MPEESSPLWKELQAATFIRDLLRHGFSRFFLCLPANAELVPNFSDSHAAPPPTHLNAPKANSFAAKATSLLMQSIIQKSKFRLQRVAGGTMPVSLLVQLHAFQIE